MKILMDTMAGDVSYAMKLLFEDRLGHELYFMRGLGWYNQGYWKHAGIQEFILEGCNIGHSEKYPWEFKTMTYNEFLENKDVDILLMISFSQEEPFRKLVRDHLPEAKIIRHIGNLWENVTKSSVDNLIISVTPDNHNIFGFEEVEQGKNWVYAHQEIDLKQFVYTPPINTKRITAFQRHDLAPHEKYWGQLFLQYKTLLWDFEYRKYGYGGEDEGVLNTTEELGKAFADTGFVWETKGGEDGGSHLLYDAFACGRPLITKSSLARGVANSMLRDGWNCIDLDIRDTEDNVRFIRECSEPGRFEEMCKNAYATFIKYVDYKKESQDVEIFLEKLR